MPGANAPPRNSPSGETTSTFVDVPKSTTITGAPYRSLAATAFHDPIGADLTRVVVADRDSGLHARADDEQRRVRPLRRQRLPLAHEHGDGGREADAVDAFELEQPAEEDAELVRRV